VSVFLEITVVFAVLVIIAVAVVYFLRAVSWLFGFLSGRHKIAAENQEKLHKEYMQPEWEMYKEFLMREPPPNMVRLYELSKFASNPIINVEGEEYYLYPIHNKDGLIEGMWFIGQNDLGEPLFLQPGINNFPIYKHELGSDIVVLYTDANEFFLKALQEHSELT